MENDKPEHTDENTKLSYEHKMLEGYMGLNQWQCQSSQDHLNYDRILMPLLVGAPIYALSSEVNNWVKTFILLGGFLLLLFWILRNERSKMRIGRGWEVLNEVEEELGFSVRRRFRDKIDASRVPRDFTLKVCFGYATSLFYFAVLFYVWCCP